MSAGILEQGLHVVRCEPPPGNAPWQNAEKLDTVISLTRVRFPRKTISSPAQAGAAVGELINLLVFDMRAIYGQGPQDLEAEFLC